MPASCAGAGISSPQSGRQRMPCDTAFGMTVVSRKTKAVIQIKFLTSSLPPMWCKSRGASYKRTDVWLRHPNVDFSSAIILASAQGVCGLSARVSALLMPSPSITNSGSNSAMLLSSRSLFKLSLIGIVWIEISIESAQRLCRWRISIA